MKILAKHIPIGSTFTMRSWRLGDRTDDTLHCFVSGGKFRQWKRISEYQFRGEDGTGSFDLRYVSGDLYFNIASLQESRVIAFSDLSSNAFFKYDGRILCKVSDKQYFDPNGSGLKHCNTLALEQHPIEGEVRGYWTFTEQK